LASRSACNSAAPAGALRSGRNSPPFLPTSRRLPPSRPLIARLSILRRSAAGSVRR
jgi:hypothetical protein